MDAFSAAIRLSLLLAMVCRQEGIGINVKTATDLRFNQSYGCQSRKHRLQRELHERNEQRSQTSTTANIDTNASRPDVTSSMAVDRSFQTGWLPRKRANEGDEAKARRAKECVLFRSACSEGCTLQFSTALSDHAETSSILLLATSYRTSTFQRQAIRSRRPETGNTAW